MTWPKTFVTSSVFKKKTQVPKPAKTSEIFRAPGHRLTFPSHVQNLIEKICRHTDFEKNERRRRSLSQHVQLFQPMAGTSLFHVESRPWARIFATTLIFEKTNAWSAARLEKSYFRMPWPGPHFPVSCPRLGPKYSSPRPF